MNDRAKEDFGGKTKIKFVCEKNVYKGKLFNERKTVKIKRGSEGMKKKSV